MRLFACLAVLVIGATGHVTSAQSGRGATPDPCTLLTKAELERVAGRSDVMRQPNQSEKMPGGQMACVIDAGAGGTTLEFIVYTRTVRTPLTPPKGAEALSGVGEGAYFQSSPDNAAVFAIAGGFALRVGVQGDEPAPALRRLAIEAARAALPKLK
jgi:hypothetical protein